MTDEEIKTYCRNTLGWKSDPNERELELIKLGAYLVLGRLMVFLTTLTPKYSSKKGGKS